MGDLMSDAESEVADGPDAIALFRPVRAEALKPFLDLDDESEESEGIYAEELEDGSFLLHTFQPFSVFEEGGMDAIQWLAQFGEALPEVHEDPRGILFFPDSIEPEATTYDGVVEEVGDEGSWLSPGDIELPEGLANAMQGVDMGALQQLAGQLLGATTAMEQGSAPPEELARMLTGLQEQLASTLGVDVNALTAAAQQFQQQHGGGAGAAAEDDEELDDDPDGDRETLPTAMPGVKPSSPPKSTK